MIAIARLLLFATALLVAGCRSEPASSGGAPSQVALWEVSGPRGEQAWLFGTVHALPENVEWQRPAIVAALGKADRFVMEIGAPVDQAAVAALLQRLGQSPGLPDPLHRTPAPQRTAIAAAFQQLEVDPTRFAGVEDWVVALQIAGIASQRAGNSAADGVETQLRGMAAGRPVIGLETIEGQLAIFDRLPASQQAILLQQTAAEIATERDEQSDLLRLWLAGNDTAIASETARGLLANPGLREALLVKRNAEWASRIEEMLRQNARPFVAVGAAHLAGPDGLPALLAARGWTVRRIP